MSSSNVRVFVGLPILTDCKFETTFSLIQYALGYKDAHNALIQGKRGTYTHSARNHLVWQAVKSKATHLMFVDADMEFDPRGIQTLLDRDLDIVGGVYHYKYPPYGFVLKNKNKDKDTGQPILLDPDNLPTEDEPFEVDVIGTGFLLIKTQVFKDMEPPFFFHCNPSDFGYKEVPFPYNEFGEDTSFCLYAKECGFKVWADPTIKLRHVGSQSVGRDTWQAYNPEGKTKPR